MKQRRLDSRSGAFAPGIPFGLLLSLAVGVACSDVEPDDGGQPTGSGGVLGSGGVGGPASGGVSAAGGRSASGGGGASGGSAGGGGVPAGGGAPATGGVSSTGGSGGIPPLADCPGEASHAFEQPAAIPGVVEAEDFDTEGYQDDSAGNEGGVYRPDEDVDIKNLADGYALGWMNAGEWTEYTVAVEETGTYLLTVSAGSVEPGRTLVLSSCGTNLAEIDVPMIGDWGAVDTTEVLVELQAGLQVLRLSVGAENDIDFDSMSFERDESGGSGGAPGTGGASTGTGGELGEIPRFVGNITTGNQVDTNDLVYSDYWDQITPENAGKWGSVQGNASSVPNWNTLDAIYDYAEEKGIVFKQHAFVWGTQQPSGSISESDVRTWMSSFCERYPRTRMIDVVNEPPPHTTPSYVNAIGGGTNGNWQWITNSFIWAREACPDAILILNDFNNIEWTNDNQHFIDIVNTVLQSGGPIDALGAQAHDLDNGAISFQTVERLLEKLHNDTGLPVYITEMDISTTNDQQQLDLYQSYFPFFRDKEYIPGITIWGWIYGRTWSSAPNSGLVRDGAPRPAMQWLMDELGRPVP